MSKKTRTGTVVMRWLVRARRMSTYGYSNRPERVKVPCGSSSIYVDLHNNATDPTTPLIVYLPPRPVTRESSAQLPAMLQNLPVAVINYQWDDSSRKTAHSWPGPVHHVSYAHKWIAEKLVPYRNPMKRDMFVFASHLGATLGASLAMTQSFERNQFAIRGFIGYNGIYDWTMFLPDHPINSRSAQPPGGTHLGDDMQRLKDALKSLFVKVADLFDPFASPGLLFQRPPFDVPDSFDKPESMEDDVSATFMAQHGRRTVDNFGKRDFHAAHQVGETNRQLNPPPRRRPRISHTVFPSWGSPLKLPWTLLLHGPDSIMNRLNKVHPHTMLAQADSLMNGLCYSLARMDKTSRGPRLLQDLVDEEGQQEEQGESNASRKTQQTGISSPVQIEHVDTPDASGDNLDPRSMQVVLNWLKARTTTSQ